MSFTAGKLKSLVASEKHIAYKPSGITVQILLSEHSQQTMGWAKRLRVADKLLT